MDTLEKILGENDDPNSINITSLYYYHEFFTLPNSMINFRIPDTTIIYGGVIKYLLYHKKSDETGIISKINDRNPTHKENFTFYTGTRYEDVPTRKEADSQENCAYVTLITGEKFALKPHEMKILYELKFDTIKIVQEMLGTGPLLNPKKKEPEGLYCHCKRTNPQSQMTFKFIKKFLSYSDIKEKQDVSALDTIIKVLNDSETIFFGDYYNLNEKKYTSRDVTKKYYKCNETTLNLQMEKEAVRLIKYIEHNFEFKVQTITLKFFSNSYEGLVYIGAKNLKIFPKDDLDDKFYSIEQYVKQFQINFHKPSKFKNRAVNNMPLNTVNVYSDKLFQKLIMDQCKGDFCRFEIVESYTYIHQKKPNYNIPKSHLVNGKLQSNKLPYEISNNFIFKVREHSEIVIKYLKKNKIFPILKHQKINNEFSTAHNDTEDYELDHDFTTFQLKPKLNVSSFSLTYDQVKICPICFEIYTLLYEFLNKLQEEDRCNKEKERWVHSEKKLMKYIESSYNMYPKKLPSLDGYKNISNSQSMIDTIQNLPIIKREDRIMNLIDEFNSSASPNKTQFIRQGSFFCLTPITKSTISSDSNLKDLRIISSRKRPQCKSLQVSPQNSKLFYYFFNNLL